MIIIIVVVVVVIVVVLKILKHPIYFLKLNFFFSFENYSNLFHCRIEIIIIALHNAQLFLEFKKLFSLYLLLLFFK